jgi:hypothetical protein
MAKRKMLFHPDHVREKIRASQLINRLQAHFFGEIELTAAQIRTAEILLRKCLPDLAAAEIGSGQAHRYVIEVPPTLSKEEWQKKYSGSLTTTPESIDLPTLSEIRQIKKMQ